MYMYKNYKEKYLYNKKLYLQQLGSSEECINYQTQITHNGPIYCLSDIHGDIFSFIISLRDCAQIIGKENYQDGINLDIVDPDIERNLLIDIRDDDNDYDETLGYNWIGENSVLVICGDIIDPKRDCNFCFRDEVSNLECNNYPQIEIKLLRFINAMNKKAMEKGGRIYKLLGNHELESMRESNSRQINKYIFDNMKTFDNYYRGNTRYNTFNYGYEGFNLLFEDSCGILLKINNTIFAHGQLPPSPLSIDDVHNDNIFINDPYLRIIGKIQLNEDTFRRLKANWSRFIIDYSNKKSILLNRDWADNKKINERYMNCTQETFCIDTIQNRIKEFMRTDDISKLRVVLGHCPQTDSSLFDKVNSTFSELLDETDVNKTYGSKEQYTGLADFTDQNKIFGITMQCPKQNYMNDHYVYHIDATTSRSFDQNYDNIQNRYDENKYLFSKTPQILLINNNNNGIDDIITIIKSKMRNTRIHLPRNKYERLIKDNPEFDINNRDIYD